MSASGYRDITGEIYLDQAVAMPWEEPADKRIRRETATALLAALVGDHYQVAIDEEYVGAAVRLADLLLAKLRGEP